MTIAYVSADDWCGIYVDGVLWYQGHSIPAFKWIELINTIEFRVAYAVEYEADYDWMYSVGHLPESFDEVKLLT